MRTILTLLLFATALLAQPASFSGHRILQKGGRGDDIPRALGRVDTHPKSQLSVLFTPDFGVFFARYAASRLKKSRIRQENHSKSAKLPESQHDLATDLTGNFYFAGTFTSNLESDSRALQSSCSHDIFPEKIERDGTTLWLVQAGGAGDDKEYLVMRFLIYPDGHVVEGSVRAAKADIQDARLTRCVLRNIARWRNFPKVESAMGSYPIVQKYIF